MSNLTAMITEVPSPDEIFTLLCLTLAELRLLNQRTAFYLPNKPSLFQLTDRFSTIALRQYLHRIHWPAAGSLFDLNSGHGAVRTGHLRISLGDSIESTTTPFERLLEVFAFHRPSPIVS